jgi:hypothetical protein
MSWLRCLLYSVSIEAVTHTSVLPTRRRGTVRRSQYQRRGQLVLELERRDRLVPVEQGTQGLVEALADLLLAALGMEVEDTISTSREGVDEQQDHG